MEERVDKIVDYIEKYLMESDIDLAMEDLDEVRDTLDYVLSKYDEEL